MTYADHLRSASVQRPNCWGHERSYDPNDAECAECRFRNSCRTEIDRGGVGHTIPVRNTVPSYRRRDDSADAGNYEPGLVQEDERPIERFAKDAVGGALRGMFYEMYQFWKNFRIR